MKAETKVGLMFVTGFIAVVAFAYFLGAFNPFTNSEELNIAYNFAGGIEVGSPVRVMGIKVGKVQAIDFVPDQKLTNGEEVKLRIRISVDKKAWPTVRSDSRYFINLAGVIGEKFLEITPGSTQSPPLKSGELVRGEDPPRIDQLISQSYSLAGKILDMVQKNEGSIVSIIDNVNHLIANFDKALRQLDKTTSNKDIAQLLKDMQVLVGNLAYFSQSLRSPEGQKTLTLLGELIRRLEPMDAKAIRKFLQEEGIKAKLF